MRYYFVAYYYERSEPGGTRVGVGNYVGQFDFHPLTDPARAAAQIAKSGHDRLIVINVQDVPES